MKKLVFWSILVICLSVFMSVGYAAELRVMTIWGGEQKAPLDQLFAEYTSLHPEVKISHEVIAGTGAATYTEVLQTQMASGTGPDVFFNWGGELGGFFADAGYCEPLDQYYEEYGWNEVLIPWTIDTVRRNGKLYGVPVGAQIMTLWYRKDLWNELGLTEPKTYQETEELCAKAKAAGIYPLSVAGKYGWMVMRLLDYLLEVTAGPELHDRLNTAEESWNRPEVIEMYRLFKKWADEWIIIGFLQISPEEARLPMYQGQALMNFEVSSLETRIKLDGQDVHNFSFFLPPTDHEPLRVCGFPYQLMINAQSKYKKEALDFVNWFIQSDVQQKGFDTVALTSTATKGVEPDPNELPNLYGYLRVMEQLEDVYPPTDQAFPPEIMNEYFEIQSSVALGLLTPEQAAAQIQSAIEKYKEEHGIEVFGSASGLK